MNQTTWMTLKNVLHPQANSQLILRKENRMVTKKSANKKAQKKVLVVRVEQEVADRLKKVCQAEGLTMNSLLNTRITNYLKSKSKKLASTN